MHDDSEYICIKKEEYDNMVRELSAARTEKNKIAREMRAIIKRNEIDRLNIETQIGFNNMISAERRKQETYIQMLLESCPVLIFIFDKELKFLLGTESITRIVLIDRLAGLHGMDIDSIAAKYCPDVFNAEIISSIKNMVTSHNVVDVEIGHQISSREKEFEVKVLPFHQDDGGFVGVLAIVHDITEIVRSKDTINILREKAAYDGLTQVYNQITFEELAKELLSKANREQAEACLFIIDIDFFKNVNDTYGHACGDLVLQNMSAVIKEVIRSNDLFGRLGGEEFGVLVTDISESNAFNLAEKLRLSVSESSIHYKNETVNVTISVGMSFYRPGQPYEELFEQADSALYQAKNSGRNKTVIK